MCLQMAIAVYEEAVQQLERQEMYRLYAAFLQERLAEQTASDNADKPPAMSTVDLLCTVHQQAADKGPFSSRMSGSNYATASAMLDRSFA